MSSVSFQTHQVGEKRERRGKTIPTANRVCLLVPSSRGPQALGSRPVPVLGLLGTEPSSRRSAAGEQAKLPLPLPIDPHHSHYRLNHPTPPSPPWKKCLPSNRPLVPKRLGTAALQDVCEVRVASAISQEIWLATLIWIGLNKNACGMRRELVGTHPWACSQGGGLGWLCYKCWEWSGGGGWIFLFLGTNLLQVAMNLLSVSLGWQRLKTSRGQLLR